MRPTLGDGDLLEVWPVDPASAIRVGDVVVFSVSAHEQPVAHRVVYAAPGGYLTRGDGNRDLDPWVVQAAQIIGRVEAVHRGVRRRRIVAGRLGNLWARILYCCNRAEPCLRRALRPLYGFAATRARIGDLLPSRLRPRVALFRVDGRNELRLLWRDRLVGRYDDARQRWRVRAPFRLLVREATLPPIQDGRRTTPTM